MLVSIRAFVELFLGPETRINFSAPSAPYKLLDILYKLHLPFHISDIQPFSTLYIASYHIVPNNNGVIPSLNSTIMPQLYSKQLSLFGMYILNFFLIFEELKMVVAIRASVELILGGETPINFSS